MAAFAKNIAVNGSREERMHLVPSPHTDKNLITRKNYGEESSDERYICKVTRPHTDNHKIYKNKKKNNPSFKKTIDLYGLLRKVKITWLKDF